MKFFVLSVGGLAAIFAVSLLWVNTAVPPSKPQVEPRFAPTAAPGEVMKTCAGIEIRSIRTAAERETSQPINSAPKEIEAVVILDSSSLATASGKVFDVSVLGPVLGSMDSPDVKTDVTCTAKGFGLTATIARSASYFGAASQNVNWRPRIRITLMLSQPEAEFQATWRMRLTTGVEVDHAQSPPYPNQTYPITITKTIR
jgi:hypothetical protein